MLRAAIVTQLDYMQGTCSFIGFDLTVLFIYFNFLIYVCMFVNVHVHMPNAIIKF